MRCLYVCLSAVMVRVIGKMKRTVELGAEEWVWFSACGALDALPIL